MTVTAHDCFWCGDVATTGPWVFDGYESPVYLCDLDAEKHSGNIQRPNAEGDR